jgi:predicted DNA-binding transcriptional regulator YafY
MARNKAQLQRLIFIDRAIRSGMRNRRLANCSTMAAEYEVSYKSIMRDIDYLKNQCDTPIAYDPQRRGFFYTEENFRLPAMNISESDLFAISLARKVLRQYENTPLHRKLHQIFRKIENSLPERVSVDPHWVDERMSVFPECRTAIDPEMWDLVAGALRRGQPLKMQYLKPGAGTPVFRRVDPYHSVSFQGEWYLIGFCHLRRQVRTFAISRIQSAAVMDIKFNIPEDFSFEKFAGHHFGIFRGERNYRVEILFEARHRPYVEEREWHQDQRLEPQADDSLLLTFTTNHLFEVKKWILSWGGGVRVLTPPELVSDIKEELRKALRAYD